MNPAWIVVGALLLVTSFKMPDMPWTKHPPVAELVAAQAKVKDLEAQSVAAHAALEQNKADQQKAKDAMVTYSHQMTEGALNALDLVPPEHMTPEVHLAHDLSVKANAGLDAYEGKLSSAQKAEMNQLVHGALSAITSERDAALAALAVKDAALKKTDQDKQALAVRVPVLLAASMTKDGQLALAKVDHDGLEAKVTLYAKTADELKTQNNSLTATASRVLWYGGIAIVCLVISYFVVFQIIPSLAQEHQGNPFLAKLEAVTRSVATAYAAPAKPDATPTTEKIT